MCVKTREITPGKRMACREWNHSGCALFAENFTRQSDQQNYCNMGRSNTFFVGWDSGPALNAKTVSHFMYFCMILIPNKITSCIWIWKLYLSRRTIQIEVWPVRTSIFWHFHLSRMVGQSLRSSPGIHYDVILDHASMKLICVTLLYLADLPTLSQTEDVSEWCVKLMNFCFQIRMES